MEQTMGFDEVWFASHWWLAFPVLGLMLASWSMWLHHRRHKMWLEVMRAYTASGRVPPPNFTHIGCP
jgi:hypothetical protein